MKKTIACFLSLVMLVAVSAMAVSAETETLADKYVCPPEYDFESGDFVPGVPQADVPGGIGFNKNGSQVIEDIGGEHGKVLSFNHPSDNSDPVALGIIGKDNEGNWGWGPVGRKLTLDLDLNIKELDKDDDYNFQIALQPQGGKAPDENLFIVFGYKGTVWANDGGHANAFDPDTWFHLSLELDMDKNEVKAYINDKLVVTDFICAEGTDMSNVTILQFVPQFRNPAHEGQKVMMDNIKVGDTFADRTDTTDTEASPDVPPTADIISVAVVVTVAAVAGLAVSKKKYR